MSILDWRETEDWKNAVQTYAREFLHEGLITDLRESGVTNCWSDDMSWLPNSTIVESIEEAFCCYYSEVKCFHGARPSNVASYFESGLLGQNQDYLEEEFCRIFSDVEERHLRQAVLELESRGLSEKGKVYLVCDDRDLVEECGHYLIQGSEYIMALAATLARRSSASEDYRLRLRKIGIPTIFEVNLPVSMIPALQLNELIRCIIASWCSGQLASEDEYDYEMNFAIHNDIGAKHIVGHYHPNRIRDPHIELEWYTPAQISCEVCHAL